MRNAHILYEKSIMCFHPMGQSFASLLLSVSVFVYFGDHIKLVAADNIFVASTNANDVVVTPSKSSKKCSDDAGY